jgi:molybdopterin-guanine dinucleotide biosynthesis protein A
MNKSSAAILAGGKSTRMQEDKSFLHLHESAETMIEHMLRKVSKFSDVFIIANDCQRYRKYGKVFPDILESIGPLAGIHSGLIHAQFDKVFFLPCDMPLFPEPLISSILLQSDGYDVCVPYYKGFQYPVSAAYMKTCIPHIEENVGRGIHSPIEIYSKVKTKKITEKCLKQFGDPAQYLINLNSAEDLSRFHSYASP